MVILQWTEGSGMFQIHWAVIIVLMYLAVMVGMFMGVEYMNKRHPDAARLDWVLSQCLVDWKPTAHNGTGIASRDDIDRVSSNEHAELVRRGSLKA